MKKYTLRVSDGEVINSVITYTLEDAIEIFALTKNLTTEQLLKIFTVDEILLKS
jgi:hypothetical protein